MHVVDGKVHLGIHHDNCSDRDNRELHIRGKVSDHGRNWLRDTAGGHVEPRIPNPADLFAWESPKKINGNHET
jgi:hypothetical protein